MKPTDDHIAVHAAFAERMRQYFSMPEFIKLRQVAGRKQVQIVLLGNYLSWRRQCDPARQQGQRPSSKWQPGENAGDIT